MAVQQVAAAQAGDILQKDLWSPGLVTSRSEKRAARNRSMKVGLEHRLSATTIAAMR